MLFPWVLCGVLSAAVVGLCVKICLLKKGAAEICAELAAHLETDTNTLITTSSNDKHIKRLAAELNQQLRLLRKQRQRYLNGDRELKDAVTNISHDLRTPLTAICGYLDLLEQEEKSEAAARYLGYIEDRTQAMKQLTEELFRYSVILSTADGMQLETVNVNAILEESAAAFYGAFTERGITPAVHIPEKKILRSLNKPALSRVFSNLLDNALKYSDGDLDISLLEDGRIVFSNAAAGLTPVQAGKLFDRFFSVETARNSTGLGLAISKALVEQMNSTITARCTGGRLSICITFPAE